MTAALVQFLRDRLNEDEQAARAATPGPWCDSGGYVTDIDQHGNSRVQVTEFGTQDEDGQGSGPQGQADSAHIARHDPARVLREVVAKRLMLDEALSSRHLVTGDHYMDCPLVTEADGVDAATADRIRALNDDYRKEFGKDPKCAERCGRDARVNRTLELLALPFVDHPDYMRALLADQA